MTALQLDVKLFGGVPPAILAEALEVGRNGRLEILQTMREAMGARGEGGAHAGVKAHAPRSEVIRVDQERVVQLILLV